MPGLLPPDRCYSAEEVAEILRLPLKKFYTHRQQLEADGMPEAIRCGRKLRYSKEAFDRWLNAPRRDKPPQEDEPGVVTAWTERLLRVYGEH